MAMTVLSYFTDEKFFYYADGEKDGEEYKITKEYEFEGNGMASDFSIVMLVNAQTISAADGLALRASSLPQVTLVGITTSNNSYQAVGGDALIKGGIYVGYPHILQLNENSEVMIDPDENGEASVNLDERVPVTSESVIGLFNEKEDIELDFAKELLAH